MLSADFARLNGTIQSAGRSKWPIAACLYCISTIQIPPEECLLHSSAFPERSGCINCWLWAIIYRHCFSVWPWLTLPTGVPLLQNITAASFCVCVCVCVCVCEGNISFAAFLTHSFCCAPKLKVNSTYWPHLESPFTCGESHPVWTRWQTEILIILLLLSSEEVKTFFRAEQMSGVQFLSKVTYEMTNRSGPLCLFFSPICLCLMRGLTCFCQRGDLRTWGYCHGYRVPFWSAILSGSALLKSVWSAPIYVTFSCICWTKRIIV